MKNKLLLLLLFSIFELTGCDETNNNSLDNDFTFDGTWIEIKEKEDTIDFTDFASEPVLNLRRGLGLINGYWIPKYGSGFYAYELIDSDSIALCWYLSSSCISGLPESYSKYFFKSIDNEKFKISNFYNPDVSPDEIFTFSRIE